ncbi:hypothetical protein [Streptomyces rubellomurinus]|uniref:Secreted protein n=2 Tax=Streptomyces TaxID=1883 RepID=A0A0F2TB57_STRR3|nr:hypothetical protein [Streptomyces rubellomurinus]KJS53704.1 hypothetical protein VM98_23685 [Streptomyces rubellomurinus subsp. indigoferus]KJS59560.1 hypothetical protein VM95_26545 [Streptomyces rubellomurinus]
MVKKSIRKIAVAAVSAAAAGAAMLGTAGTAHAAEGDRIDVGFTVVNQTDAYQKVSGSGSYTNAGGISRVCISIQRRYVGYGWDTVSTACRSVQDWGNTSEFSAPDFWVLSKNAKYAADFKTKVEAFDQAGNSALVKYSNQVAGRSN